MRKVRVLYLSYDGALDPLGRSQVVPLLERLSALGHQVHLLTFEKKALWEQPRAAAAMRRRLTAAGISWWPMRYHKVPTGAATAYDLSLGLLEALWIVRRYGIQVVHARSYPPALIALSLQRLIGLPYIFDIRGLYPEERVEAGLWSREGRTFKATKRLERAFLRHATAVITLTRASVPVLQQMLLAAGGSSPIVVIPTTVDLDLFSRAPTREGRPFTLAYAGSIGGWYMLPEMLAFGRVLLDQIEASRLLFLVNQGEVIVRRAARELGIPDDRVDIRGVLHEQLPGALRSASVTMSFVRPTFSKIASAATKVSESLALGIPVAVNPGVGDTAGIVEKGMVGIVLSDFGPAAYSQAVDQMRRLHDDPGTAERCRRVAEQEADVRLAAVRYSDLYISASG